MSWQNELPAKVIILDPESPIKEGLVTTWEEAARFIFLNCSYDDAIFGVLNNQGIVLWSGYYDSWKEEQFSGIPKYKMVEL